VNRTVSALVVLALATVVIVSVSLALRHQAAPFHGPRWYQHIFVIVLENHSYEQIIGNRQAPHLNALARRYGLATHYYAVAHPSEPNYVSLIGGSFFDNRNDNPYQPVGRNVNHPIRAPSLADQLEASGLTWKSYQQSLPHAGYLGLYFPTSSRPLYVFRHNPFLAFADVQQNPVEWRKIVPDTQLAGDVRRGQVPTFGFISPDLCHDMHGQWPMCRSAQTPGDAYDQRLIREGDAYVGSIVHLITSARFWSKGNNAIVITWDENDYPSWQKGVSGCCGAAPGGGHVAAIVVTSHGRHGVHDTTWYNHYSLLRTIQVALHLGCLQNTCDTGQVRVMWPLFVAKR
jgi:hypothetical protein